MRVPIKIAARSSPLSQAQVREVLDPLKLPYEATFVNTHGDLDRTTSLRALDKTDFFTREVDDLLLNGTCDIAIHSAKDLPQELPEGLKIIAITAGLDSSDSLVIRENASLETINLVATSSVRREEAVSKLCPHASFCDIRGTIIERLAKLESGEVDGVVIAEAALLRLNLSPKRITLPGETTPLQGQLAIVGLHGKTYPAFEALDTRNKETLYFGLRCANPLWHHFPIIKTEEIPFVPVQNATHYIFTSRTAAKIYKPFLQDQPLFCTGKATAAEFTGFETFIAEEEQAEGVVALLEREPLPSNSHFVWPRSKEARNVISDWFEKREDSEKGKFTEIPLYDIHTTDLPPPDISPFKRIIFTSPSTVKAFIELYGSLPLDKELISIGPITASLLKQNNSV